jgi:hypothetical protein
MPEDEPIASHEEHHTYVLSRCESYSDERKTLLSTLLSVTERFDKWLIGLPAGSAGLSLVFYEKVASQAEAVDLKILALSWSLLSIAIASGFVSLYLSTLAVGRQFVILDEEHTDFLMYSTPSKPQGKKRRKPLSNCWTPWTGVANALSALSSIAGVALFLYFAYTVASSITDIQTNARQRQTPKEGGLPPTDEQQAAPPATRATD